MEYSLKQFSISNLCFSKNIQIYLIDGKKISLMIDGLNLIRFPNVQVDYIKRLMYMRSDNIERYFSLFSMMTNFTY